MSMDIKIGAVAWGLPGGGAFAPSVAHEANLNGIQLEMGTYENGYPLTQSEVIRGYNDAATQYNLEYPSIVLNDVMYHPYIYGKDTPDGKIAYDQIPLVLEAAEKLSIDRVMIPNFELNLITEKEHVIHTIDYLRFACELARKKDILILTETGLDASEQKEMMKEVNAPNLKVFFDTQNYKFNHNMDQCEQLNALYELMDDQIHTKDGINAPGEMLLGNGDTDFFEQMQILKDRKFSGWIIIENYYNLMPLRDEAPNGNQMDLLQIDIATVKRCLSM